jgi:hypothetical protein
MEKPREVSFVQLNLNGQECVLVGRERFLCLHCSEATDTVSYEGLVSVFCPYCNDVDNMQQLEGLVFVGRISRPQPGQNL